MCIWLKISYNDIHPESVLCPAHESRVQDCLIVNANPLPLMMVSLGSWCQCLIPSVAKVFKVSLDISEVNPYHLGLP
jgi:hypothetical protein